MTSALLEREDRRKREPDGKDEFVGGERVGHLTAIYSDLLAAEKAWEELSFRGEALRT